VESARTGHPSDQMLTLVQFPHRIPEPGQLGGAGAGVRQR
jgi:hypothetical protein